LVYYRKSQFSSPDKSIEYIHLSKKNLETALEMQKAFNSENLELAITKHAYGRTAIKLKDFDMAEHALSNALRIAKDYCKQDTDHYEVLVIKRSYGHYLCRYKTQRFEEGLQYLKEAFEGKLRLYEHKPHQAVIGTIELIIDVHSLNPKNKELLALVPTIVRYLDNWVLSEKSDPSKHINHQLMNERINAIKNNLHKIGSENKTSI
jgi:tetratricopeptide (TPR) repeat protein